MNDNQDDFSKNYSEGSFWDKLRDHARAAGEEIVYKALQLYYAGQKPEMPGWARATIYGALGYFIFPFDAVPDVLPGTGFLDDLGVLAWAFATVAMHIDEATRAKAMEKTREWFGTTAGG